MNDLLKNSALKSDALRTSLNPYIMAVSGRKAQDIVVLDVRGLTSLADAFIICGGNSNRQVSAIADFIVKDLKEQGIIPLSVEGRQDGRWVLLDYGEVVIHVFFESVRLFYDIEGLWSDAARTDIPNGE